MIKVKIIGKANAEFIVKNQKKIEYWRMLYKQNQQFSNFIKIDIEEIKDKK